MFGKVPAGFGEKVGLSFDLPGFREVRNDYMHVDLYGTMTLDHINHHLQSAQKFAKLSKLLSTGVRGFTMEVHEVLLQHIITNMLLFCLIFSDV